MEAILGEYSCFGDANHCPIEGKEDLCPLHDINKGEENKTLKPLTSIGNNGWIDE